MSRGAMQPGAAGPFDILAPGEWVMLVPFCADAGRECAATASFEGRRRVRVTDVRGAVVGALALDGHRIATPGDALENGLAAQPTCAFDVPADMPGGMYFIDDQWAFLVSRPNAAVRVVISLSTMQAFNNWGGRSHYSERKRQRGEGDRKPLHIYSVHRPLAKRFATDAVHGFLAWLPHGALAGRDVGFLTDRDLARPGVLDGTKLLLIVGRSEYWSRESRVAFDAHVARGGDAILLSSETMLHEIRQDGDRNAWWWRGSPHDPARPRTSRWADPDRFYPLLPSIGPNPSDGAHHNPEAEAHPDWGVYHAVDTASPLARACGIRPGDTIPLPSAVYFDGLPLAGYEGDIPVLDASALPFHKWSLIAHSFGRDTPQERIGAWFAFQRTPDAGRVVHFGSYAWSGKEGLGGEGRAGGRPAEIVDATIRLLLSGENIFG